MCSSIIKLFNKLISIPSISPNDMGCQKIISKELLNMGFSIKNFDIKDTKNIWAEIGNKKNGKTLNFLGHTDVVPSGNLSNWKFDPFVPTIYEGKLYGRGSSDMKGSISSFIIAIKRFLHNFKNNMKGRITILLTSDEEGNAKNGIKKVVKKLIKNKEKIDYCIIGEPTSEKFLGDTIKNGRRGSLHLKLFLKGKGGHIAYKDYSENLIHKASFFINDLIKLDWHDKFNNKDENTNVQVSKIFSEDTVENMISENLFIRINFRFSYKISVNYIKSYVKKLLNYYKIKYNMKWKLSAKPFVNKNSRLLNSVVETIVFFNKKKPNVSMSGGTSDGRFIKKMKPEIIELGLLNNTIHKPNEFVKISDLKKLSKIYEKIIEKLLL
ncbi:succinyl-diaminopimelate desuccinylase [Buchnera aphidicola (Ceratovacuna keduensis)]|uniref:succinyl-diaminopimelate desuccinylase n=1 Tax=Buchnera aphidicola TaxID=9 RepID=UPI0031B87A25